jgi:hypothetical protein
MISSVSHGDDMVDDERRGLSSFRFFAIAANISVGLKDFVSLSRRYRSASREKNMGF